MASCSRCYRTWVDATRTKLLQCPKCGVIKKRSWFASDIRDIVPVKRRRKKSKRREMPKFRGRWKGRLIYHWKRSPAKFSITSAFLDRLWIAQEAKCAYCETTIDDETLVLEHMEPLALGGRTSEDNICLACNDCNQNKGAMSWKNWAKLKGL